MEANMLIAMDASERAYRCVDFVGRVLRQTDDVRVTLLCILDSPISSGVRLEALSTDMRRRMSRLNRAQAEVDAVQAVFNRATQALLSAGVRAENITTKFKVKENGVAEDIRMEVEDGAYDVVVIGRRGLSRLKSVLWGSVSNSLVCRIKCAAIWVVP